MEKMELQLTGSEKNILRKKRIGRKELAKKTTDEIRVLLEVSLERARNIHAICEFQKIPSVGIRFATDLVELGIYSLDDLKGRDASDLLNAFELKKGFWIDPCVEDQFRLVVHTAETGDKTKKWWDFTAERKRFRMKHGYPSSRPKKAWHELDS